MLSPTAADRVQAYFRALTRSLLAGSDEAISGHSGLTGSHRETVCRDYLTKILPRRHDIGRGIVYGFAHRSREADVVIWDADNFPRIQLADHTFLFSESVRVILEVKSRWSSEELDDIRTKVRAARDIIGMSSPNLADQLAMIHLEIEALKQGAEHDGILSSKPHIGTGAIVLHGGQSVGSELAARSLLDDVDDEWPDILLLLEAGKFVLKRYVEHDDGRVSGQLEFYELGEDALLRFTGALLELLADRVVHSEAPLYFEAYGRAAYRKEPVDVKAFPLRRFAPFRHPLWRRG